MSSMIDLGLDGHTDAITVAVLPGEARAPTRIERLPNDFTTLHRFCERLAAEGAWRAGYEASGAGDGIHRARRAGGHSGEVIAPSVIPATPGQQRQHDQHEAAPLARLYRAGDRTTVRPPGRGRGARARPGALPRDAAARGAQEPPRPPEVPGAARVRLSRGHDLEYGA
jgi:hypothetical protein